MQDAVGQAVYGAAPRVVGWAHFVSSHDDEAIRAWCACGAAISLSMFAWASDRGGRCWQCKTWYTVADVFAAPQKRLGVRDE